VILLDPESGRLQVRAGVGPGSAHLLGASWSLREDPGLVRDAIRQRRTQCPEAVSPERLPPAWQNLRPQSAVAIPLVLGFDVLGVMVLTHPQPGRFRMERIQLLETVGAQMAQAIHNAALYHLITQQAEQLGNTLRAAQEEASKRQAILESIAEGVMVADARGEVIMMNAAAERILGLRREEVLGRPSATSPASTARPGRNGWPPSGAGSPLPMASPPPSSCARSWSRRAASSPSTPPR
jgi:PAS domain-containing protein